MIPARHADHAKKDARFVDVVTQLHRDGTPDVIFDGVKSCDHSAFGHMPIEGQFGFGAAASELTAVLNANFWNDDLSISTTTVSGAFVGTVSASR